MDPFRDELGDAHEKIAQLETQLARLKRGFDPEPLANPISEEEHVDAPAACEASEDAAGAGHPIFQAPIFVI